jgi:hypothetical protein
MKSELDPFKTNILRVGPHLLREKVNLFFLISLSFWDIL